MRKYLWLLIVFAACDSADQNTEAEEVLYRTAFVDHAYDAAALPDGSLIVAGATEGRIGLGDWTNAFNARGRGLGGTRPNGWIRARIDHVLLDAAWRVVQVRVAPDVGSDHLPVVATVRPR